MYHPSAAKNYKLKERFEEFEFGGKRFRYNGGKNESRVYKVPDKLPALVLFREVDGFKAVIEYQLIQELMVHDLTQEDFNKKVTQFVEQRLF